MNSKTTATIRPCQFFILPGMTHVSHNLHRHVTLKCNIGGSQRRRRELRAAVSPALELTVIRKRSVGNDLLDVLEMKV